MKDVFRIALRTVLLLVLSINFAKAAIIGFTVNSLGGNNWRYEYTVANNSPSVLEEFTIFFDEAKVMSIFNASGPDGWDLLLIQPDPALPAAGFFDALSLDGGLALGGAASFAVDFEYFGSGTPGAQQFAVIDPLTFQIIDNGMTQGPASVPVPATVWLMLPAIAAMALARRRGPAARATLASMTEARHG